MPPQLKVRNAVKQIAQYASMLLLLLLQHTVRADEIFITGKVTTADLSPLRGSKVTFSVNNFPFTTTTRTDGTYRILISNLLPGFPPLLETGNPFPQPFTGSVSIPVITGVAGNLEFAIFTLNGSKIAGRTFNTMAPGSYRITWDGKSINGRTVSGGIYIYAVTLNGKTVSGRVIYSGAAGGSGGISIYPFMLPGDQDEDSGMGSGYNFEAEAAVEGFHTARLTGLKLKTDTVIDFTLIPVRPVPFKTNSDHIAVYETPGNYRSLILKGINLGSSPPGYFPGEIAYAISPEMYEEWIEMMGDAGFNSVRVYTLHPPVFYEKLAEYNYRNPSRPLYLFQGVWLDEPESPSDPDDNLLTSRSSPFRASIREVIDCVHGNRSVPFRPGRAFGEYRTDISPWIAGYILGREISPTEIITTDNANPGTSDWTGNKLSVSGATASELFTAMMIDEALSYESDLYNTLRPVSMSSWPTLDPLSHPTEISTDEDVAQIDITKITQLTSDGFLFASYHAYPYYPDFISDEPAYREYSDEDGPNNYPGYLHALRNHYTGIPLIIAEFGVPSSWGNAHNSFSGMHHGGLSEIQQGRYNLRMLRNIINSGCGGGFMFSWMDEWFKPTWIVLYMEAFGFLSGGATVPTRQLWHNLVSPEQNFGLITFDDADEPSWQNLPVSSQSAVTKTRVAQNNGFLYLEVSTANPLNDGDTIWIAIDTHLSDTGESKFPSGELIPNRSEFLLEAVRGADSVTLFVTEAYDMFGLTPRFNHANMDVQKFRSTVSDGSPWRLMRWVNNGSDGATFNIGKLPAETARSFTEGERTALLWNENVIKVRLPWTLIYFYDPTRLMVINGAESADGGKSYEILSRQSDGIAFNILNGGTVTYSSSRFTWPAWSVAPATRGRTKKSLEIIKQGLLYIPNFAN